jgi:hypothetical protein
MPPKKSNPINQIYMGRLISIIFAPPYYLQDLSSRSHLSNLCFILHFALIIADFGSQVLIGA